MFDSLFPKEWTTLQRLMWLKTNALARAVYETITGNPVSFTAKAAPLRQLSVAFSPVQDLHGYDSPWPAGGGKNLVDPNATIYKRYLRDAGNGSYYWTYSADSASIVIKVEPETAYTLSRYLTSGGIYRCSTIRVASLPSENDTTDIQTYQNVRETTATAFGTTRTVTTDSSATYVVIQFNGATVRDFVVNGQFEKGSSATDYAPYSNECPISGWSSLTVEQRGVNMWDEEWENARINLTTGAVASGNGLLSKNLIPVKPNTQYHAVSGSYAGGTSFLFAYYDADGSYLNYEVKFGMSVNFTTPANARFIRFNIQTSDAVTYNHDASINYPSTDTAYHAYNPSSRSISISLGQTVYSGYVDVISGVGEVTMASVDLGTLDWNYSASGNPFFYATKSDIKRPADWGAIPNWLCSSYKTVSGNAVSGGTVGIGGNPNASQIRLCDPTYTDKDTFKTAMSGVQFAYELAEPIPIQLTPQEVQSLAGDNTMWSDANDDLTVEYRSN